MICHCVLPSMNPKACDNCSRMNLQPWGRVEINSRDMITPELYIVATKSPEVGIDAYISPEVSQ